MNTRVNYIKVLVLMITFADLDSGWSLTTSWRSWLCGCNNNNNNNNNNSRQPMQLSLSTRTNQNLSSTTTNPLTFLPRG